MKVRLLNVLDYPKLVDWWNDNRFTPPSRDMLPEHGDGGLMIQTESGEDVCAGFLYLTNSKCAWIEWIVADFNYRESDRGSAILLLIESLKILAKQNGFTHIFTSVKNPHLIKKYEACGFAKGDNSQEMIISI